MLFCSANVLPSVNVPPETTVVPVYVFAPDKVSEPPVMVRFPTAPAFTDVASLITPEKTVVVPPPPTVKVVDEPAVALPKTTLLDPAPLFANEAIEGVALVKLTVAVPEDGFSRTPPVADELPPSA